ncbi:hypothetical protein DSO57_1009623, partial [Entomophthora muscae]
MGAPIYWKLSMRALRLGGWKIHKNPSNTAHPLHNEFIQNRMWVSCTNNNARASLALMITNLKFPLTYQTQKVTSNTYATVSKWKSKPQYPQKMKDWMEEGVDISMRPKDIFNGMNCKLVPIKVQSITWRVLNCAYLSGTYCSESYLYKECTVCDEKRAGVDHQYFG